MFDDFRTSISIDWGVSASESDSCELLSIEHLRVDLKYNIRPG